MTRAEYGVESAIDLCICSDDLTPVINWHALSSPGDSDQCPIILTVMGRRRNVEHPMKKWHYKLAHWELFADSPAWRNFSIEVADLSAGESIVELYNRIERAAESNIPKVTASRFYPKPRWTRELQQSRSKRERLYQAYRRNRSSDNLIKWKAARAAHKRKVRESKKECWRKFVEEMNVNTSIAKVYEIVRKIRGKQQKQISILYTDGEYFTTLAQIVSKFVNHFSVVSSDNNYTREFQVIKAERERVSLDLRSDNAELYNRGFQDGEFEDAYLRTKETSPGRDCVTYRMIKVLSEESKRTILNIFNKMWTEGYIPQEWKHSTVIPIVKPGKDASKPESYRPIALTSCLCKLMERMINTRLVEYLEMERTIDKVQ